MTHWTETRLFSRRGLGLLVVALLACLHPFAAPAAYAGADRGTFTVYLEDGTAFSGNQTTTIPAAQAGGWAYVQGTYTEFGVDLTTFAVSDYTLTGAPARTD